MRTSTQIWLKVIRRGALAGALIGFLWASGLLWVVGLIWGRARSGVQIPEHTFDPGYLHRLGTYPLYGLVVGILIVCFLGINKLLRYLIAGTGPDAIEESPADKREHS